MTEHKQGCDALGGYGHGVGPCTCGGQAGGVLTPVAPAMMDVTLDGQEAQIVWDMLGDDRDDLAPLRLLLGDGHSGVGLYAASAEYPEEGAMFLAAVRPRRPTPAAAARPTDDKLWDQALTERDRYHDTADALAEAIGAHLGISIGEHSSDNDPWRNALTAIRDAASPAAAAEPVGHVNMRIKAGCGDGIKWTGWALPHGTPLFASPVAGAPTEERRLLQQGVDAIGQWRDADGFAERAQARFAQDEFIAQARALLSAGSQGEQHDSSHEAAPQSSAPAPRSSLSETDKSALPLSPTLEDAYADGRRDEADDWLTMAASGMPPCDGETVFVGINTAGFACCFNEVTPDGVCSMQGPELSTVQMSGLQWWRKLARPLKEQK